MVDPILLIPISLVFATCMIVGRNELVRRKLSCPHTGKRARVDVLRRALNPSKLVRVKACSLLTDPNRVDCDQACLRSSE